MESGLRLLGARAFERGGASAWGLGCGQWGGQGGLGAEKANWGVGSGCLVKGGQVLGVVRVVSGPRGRIGEWAQAAWCEGV